MWAVAMFWCQVSRLIQNDIWACACHGYSHGKGRAVETEEQMEEVVALLPERVEGVEVPNAVSGCHDLDVRNGQHRACYSIPQQWELSYFEHCKVGVSRLFRITFQAFNDRDIQSRTCSMHQINCPIQRPLHRRMQAARPIRAWRALVCQSTPNARSSPSG